MHESQPMDAPLHYVSIFLAFARNSLVRAMGFRVNFLVECLTSVTWMGMNLGFYVLIFERVTPTIGGSGWGKWEFCIFLATTMIVNSLVQTFFMPNCQEISEMIRTGGLDYALLKPIDTQFFVSLQKMDWSDMTNFFFGLSLLTLGVFNVSTREVHPAIVTPWTICVYVTLVGSGVALMYSLMIALSATSIWLGQNQSLYDFWFYITNFSRYPMEIYDGAWGAPLRWIFTFVAPILVVVNVPARVLAQPFAADGSASWPGAWLPWFAIAAAAISFFASRRLFTTALDSYRSASS